MTKFINLQGTKKIMKKASLILALSTAIFSSASLAHNIQLNRTLPQVSVAQDGEMKVSGKDVKYQVWNSSQLAGKVRIVHHFAGRTAVKEKNEPLMTAIKAAKFDGNKYQTTTIINADDAIIATGMFVKSSAEDGKKANPHSQVVLDQKSAVKNAWNLKGKESAIIVLDKNGKVHFVAEGKLSAASVKEVIELVHQLIGK